MGGSQSVPRKVSVENPDDNVIRITDNVASRLIQPSTQEVDVPKKQQRLVSTSDVNVDTSDSSATYVTSHQIRRELNNEIDRNNTYWENRLNILRDGYRKISVELEEEYNKAVKEVNQSLGKHFTGSGKDEVQSCQQSRKNVVECYSLNKSKPLLCSEQVQKFNDCVASGMSLILKSKWCKTRIITRYLVMQTGEMECEWCNGKTIIRFIQYSSVLADKMNHHYALLL